MTLPEPPELKKFNILGLNALAQGMDRAQQQDTNRRFKQKHKPLWQAEKIFEGQVLKDQQGEDEMMPAMQRETVRAGIGGAMKSFGALPGTMAPDSAGQASIAVNLGQKIQDRQNFLRQQSRQSLFDAETLFPREPRGLSGENAVQLEMQNIANENAANQAAYANTVQGQQYNTQAAAQGEAADAQKKQAMIGAGVAVLGTVALVF